jgi:outer membrane protein OmpA-like peptidoglycan-associated protein
MLHHYACTLYLNSKVGSVTRNGILFSGLTALFGLALMCTKHHYVAPTTTTSASATVPASAINAAPLIAADSNVAKSTASNQSNISKSFDSSTAVVGNAVGAKSPAREIKVAQAKRNLANLPSAPKAKARVFKAKTAKRKMVRTYSVSAAYACDQTKQPNLVGSICFDFNSSRISAASQAKLNKLAPTLTSQNQIVELAGFADSRGGQGYNQTLSNLRSEAVKAYLVSKGIDASKLTVKAYGSQAGKQFQKQRRVDLKVVQL